MEDLREIGNKTIESIKKRKPSEVGDLVIAMGELVRELREDEEDQAKREKFNHLHSLLGVLMHGGEYVLVEKEAVAYSGFMYMHMPKISPNAPGNPPPGLPIQPLPFQRAASVWRKMGPAEQAKLEADMAEEERNFRPFMGIDAQTGKVVYAEDIRE